jgi:hypothetical protein
MKRRSLLIATLATLSFTSIVLAHTGWCFNRASRPVVPHRSGPCSQVKSHDAISAEAALRYRQCQPTHWRTWLLQR